MHSSTETKSRDVLIARSARGPILRYQIHMIDKMAVTLVFPGQLFSGLEKGTDIENRMTNESNSHVQFMKLGYTVQ